MWGATNTAFQNVRNDSGEGNFRTERRKKGKLYARRDYEIFTNM